MIVYKEGNILDATENIIVQSVNHQGVMKAGLAKQISDKYPLANAPNSMYRTMCKEMDFADIKVNGLIAWCNVDPKVYIASIFGQDRYGRDKQYTDYVALGNGLDSVRLLGKHNGYSIAIPYGIGCGLGGGIWDVVENIIENCFSYSPEVKVTIYEYKNMIHGSP